MLCEVILTSLEDHQQVSVLVGLAHPQKVMDKFSEGDISSTKRLMTLLLDILSSNVVRIRILFYKGNNMII